MIQADEWLSQQFYPKKVYRYLAPFDAKELPEGFIYGKINRQDIHFVNSLIVQGFELVETSLLFSQKDFVPHFQEAASSFSIRMAVDKDNGFVQEIAQYAFVNSRFYQDSNISAELASSIKKNWVANYFLGKRGTDMIVCENENAVIIGFMLLVNNTIDLITVTPAYCRHGIALKMIGFANQKYGILNAGTQSSNKASIRLYQKAEFFLKDIQFVLHKHHLKL